MTSSDEKVDDFAAPSRLFSSSGSQFPCQNSSGFSDMKAVEVQDFGRVVVAHAFQLRVPAAKNCF